MRPEADFTKNDKNTGKTCSSLRSRPPVNSIYFILLIVFMNYRFELLLCRPAYDPVKLLPTECCTHDKTRPFPLPDLNTLPQDIRTKILEVQEKAGFVPNVFLALARRPAEWRAFFAYHDALMLKEEGSNPNGSLSKGDREMIVTATSAANQCLYCVVAHGALLRIYEKKPLVADQVAVNFRKADITPRQRAMLDFAMKVCQRSHEIDDGDFATLHAHGF